MKPTDSASARRGVLRSLAVHPGFLFIASLAVAGVMERLVSLPLPIRPGSRAIQGMALGLSFLGAILFLWSFRTFSRHATSPEPGSKPRALITDGPFRFSRNPMYVALLAVSLAFALLAESVWFFAATAALAAILDRSVIAREETVMSAAFGDAYEVYRSRVRRWV